MHKSLDLLCIGSLAWNRILTFTWMKDPKVFKLHDHFFSWFKVNWISGRCPSQQSYSCWVWYKVCSVVLHEVLFSPPVFVVVTVGGFMYTDIVAFIHWPIQKRRQNIFESHFVIFVVSPHHIFNDCLLLHSWLVFVCFSGWIHSGQWH